MSVNKSESEDALGSQIGFGCCFSILFMFACSLVALIGFYDPIKSVLGAILAAVTFVPLALFGLVPIGGQYAYPGYAPGIIDWAFGLLQIDPNISLPLPEWINTIVSWLAFMKAPDDVTGTIGSYVYALGLIQSMAVSVVVNVWVLILLLRKSRRAWAVPLAIIISLVVFIVARVIYAFS